MMGVLETGLARYFSPAQLCILREVSVGISGAGGLGSNVAMMLVRSGIRSLTILDNDIVEASNLNRQAFFPGDVGKPKVQALSAHLLALEPVVRLVVHECTITRENAVTLFADCPIVVEAVDVAETKVMLYEVFAPIKDLYVTASGLAGYGGSGEHMMTFMRPRCNVVAVGDFSTAVGDVNPPLAPRVMQAAGMQADAVLNFILSGGMDNA